MNTKAIAQDTVTILERGTYTLRSGETVAVAQALAECVRETTCHLPDELTATQGRVLSDTARFPETQFTVTNETTLEAAARLTAGGEFNRVCALNFASARNPGGGFLGGAKAQEESIARSSGLYHSLLTCPDHYAHHRTLKTCLYSDRMIYSPGVPVFKRDDGALLDAPYLVDVLTSPAPNAGAVRKNEPENVSRIAPVLWERTGKLLALAAGKGCDALILGAWGCGVFRNDPALVAQTFAGYLAPGAPFWGRFRLVHFAVLDTSNDQAIFTPFAQAFGHR